MLNNIKRFTSKLLALLIILSSFSPIISIADDDVYHLTVDVNLSQSIDFPSGHYNLYNYIYDEQNNLINRNLIESDISGDKTFDLSSGTYYLEFLDVSGYITPESRLVHLIHNAEHPSYSFTEEAVYHINMIKVNVLDENNNPFTGADYDIVKNNTVISTSNTEDTVLYDQEEGSFYNIEAREVIFNNTLYYPEVDPNTAQALITGDNLEFNITYTAQYGSSVHVNVKDQLGNPFTNADYDLFKNSNLISSNNTEDLDLINQDDATYSIAIRDVVYNNAYYRASVDLDSQVSGPNNRILNFNLTYTLDVQAIFGNVVMYVTDESGNLFTNADYDLLRNQVAINESLNEARSLNGQVSGDYSINAREVLVNGVVYHPVVSLISNSSSIVSNGDTVQFMIRYMKWTETGDVLVKVLDNNLNPFSGMCRLFRYDEIKMTLSATSSYHFALRGEYKVEADNVTVDGVEYIPSINPISNDILLQGDNITFQVIYTPVDQTGNIEINVLDELGNQFVNADYDILKNGNILFANNETSKTLNNQVFDTYSIDARDVNIAGVDYVVSISPSQSQVLNSANNQTSFTLTYSRVYRGNININIVDESGNPFLGGDSDLFFNSVFLANYSETAQLQNQVNGTYSVSARDVTKAGITYSPQIAINQADIVNDGDTVNFTIRYVQSTITGNVNVRVVDENGTLFTDGDYNILRDDYISPNYHSGITLNQQLAGTYYLSARSVFVNGVVYAPSYSPTSLDIVNMGDNLNFTLVYKATSQTNGRLSVDVLGENGGLFTHADYNVYYENILAYPQQTATLNKDNQAYGHYQVVANDVIYNNKYYRAIVANHVTDITANSTLAMFTVTYTSDPSVILGHVNIRTLDENGNPFTLANPDYDLLLDGVLLNTYNSDQNLTNQSNGTYTINARNITDSLGNTYTATVIPLTDSITFNGDIVNFDIVYALQAPQAVTGSVNIRVLDENGNPFTLVSPDYDLLLDGNLLATYTSDQNLINQSAGLYSVVARNVMDSNSVVYTATVNPSSASILNQNDSVNFDITYVNQASSTIDLNLSHTTSPSSAKPLDHIAYVLDITNNSNLDANNLVLTVDVDSNLENFQLPVNCALNQANTSFTCNIPSLAAGATISYAYFARVIATATDSTVIKNTASVSADEQDIDNTNNSNIDAILNVYTVYGDLSITKTVDKAVLSNQNGLIVNYTIRVERVNNMHPGRINATVTDSLTGINHLLGTNGASLDYILNSLSCTGTTCVGAITGAQADLAQEPISISLDNIGSYTSITYQLRLNTTNYNPINTTTFNNTASLDFLGFTKTATAQSQLPASSSGGGGGGGGGNGGGGGGSASSSNSGSHGGQVMLTGDMKLDIEKFVSLDEKEYFDASSKDLAIAIYNIHTLYHKIIIKNTGSVSAVNIKLKQSLDFNDSKIQVSEIKNLKNAELKDGLLYIDKIKSGESYVITYQTDLSVDLKNNKYAKETLELIDYSSRLAKSQDRLNYLGKGDLFYTYLYSGTKSYSNTDDSLSKDLSLDLEATSFDFKAGDTSEFTITLNNNTDRDITGILLNHKYDTNLLELVGNTEGFKVKKDNTLLWEEALLPAGEKIEFKFSLKAKEDIKETVVSSMFTNILVNEYAGISPLNTNLNLIASSNLSNSYSQLGEFQLAQTGTKPFIIFILTFLLSIGILNRKKLLYIKNKKKALKEI